MYLYYDRYGNLKEKIVDRIARVGNHNWNTIYVYWDDASAISNVYVNYRLADGTPINNVAYSRIENIGYIPATDYDLKFFVPGKPYRFFVFNIPDNVLTLNNDVVATFRIVTSNNQSIVTLGVFVFKVDGRSAFIPQEHINIAEFNYLNDLINPIYNDTEKHCGKWFNDNLYRISGEKTINGNELCNLQATDVIKIDYVIVDNSLNVIAQQGVYNGNYVHIYWDKANQKVMYYNNGYTGKIRYTIYYTK